MLFPNVKMNVNVTSLEGMTESQLEMHAGEKTALHGARGTALEVLGSGSRTAKVNLFNYQDGDG